MKKAKWIWLSKDIEKSVSPDNYVIFLSDAVYDGGDAFLRISADSNYQVWINGSIAGFGQYADYPHYKVYDEIPVKKYLHKGKNRIAVLVWYYGIATQTYYIGNPGVCYELECNGEILCSSSEDTLSRFAYDHVSGIQKIITTQIGFSFCYDARKNDGYLKENYVPEGFCCSEITDGSTNLIKRPSRRLELGPFIAAKQMKGKKGIYDLGEETVGFLRISYKAPLNKKFSVLFGEHLADGKVRDIIGPRDFSVEIISDGKQKTYTNYFRRLGCRYLEIRADDVEIKEIGIIPVNYPVKTVEFSVNDPVWQKIYDVSVRTLKLCMHEHYEDCPWREQALYIMDSRNQMLSGYYTFNEYLFPRANLELMAQAQKPDKLLPLCFPASSDVPIPFFSLMYVKEMREYAEYSKDNSLLVKYIGLLRDIVGVFVNNVDKNGLIPDMDGYWNFYEWSDGMDGIIDNEFVRHIKKHRYELPLICFTLIAIDDLHVCEKLIGEDESFLGVSDIIRKSAFDKFYKPQEKVFCTFDGTGHLAKLANSLAILAGVAGNKDKEIAESIVKGKMVETTLSMKTFEYDALLKVDYNYKDYILKDIYKNYSYMLSCGATSFWETLNGESDFGDAGSLCHGWSAITVYYMWKLLGNKK